MLGPTSAHSSASEIGLLGKVPMRPDFVHWGARSGTTQLFDRWLVTAVERLRQRRAPLPTRSLRFVWCSGDAATALVGVLAPSCDKLGRAFPVAAFREVKIATLRAAWSAIPCVYEPFLGQAEALLATLSGQAWEPVSRALLELPGALEAPDRASRDEAPDAKRFLRAAFGDERGAQAYALLTMLRATSGATSPRTRTPMLACPVSAGADLEAWLTVLERFCPSVDLSFLWSDSEPRQLLFGCRHPPEDALCAVSDPVYGSNTIWPLKTERGAALENARGLLAAQFTELESAVEVPLFQLATLMRGAKL